MEEKTIKVCYEGKEVNVDKKKFDDAIVKTEKWNYLNLNNGDRYFYMHKTSRGMLYFNSKTFVDEEDKDIIINSVCFKTKQECKKYIKIHNELTKISTNIYDIDWYHNKEIYSFYIDFDEKRVICDCVGMLGMYSGEKYIFENKEACQLFIDKYTYEEFIKYVYCLKGMF